MKEIIKIEGMGCVSCAQKIEKNMRTLAGVSRANVNFASEELIVHYDDEHVREYVIQRIRDLGYTVKTTTDGVTRLKKRLVYSFCFLVPLLYLAMGHMIGLSLPSVFHQNWLLVLVQLVCALPIAWINRQYYQKGFKQLWQKSPTMDSLVAIGTAAAYLQAIAVFITQTTDGIYVESGAVILTFITAGKYLEQKAKHKTNQAIDKLLDLKPASAQRVTLTGEETVLTEQLRVNDMIVVRPGESIAVDGVIVNGETEVDESMLTGESMPVVKKQNDTVVGGSINSYGTIYVRVSQVGSETMLAKIVSFVKEAQGSKAPIAQLADRVSRYFVPMILCLAAASFVIWCLLTGDLRFALQIAIGVLIIACPCALGLATPTALMVSIGKAASNGLLIKDGQALETMGKVDTIVLDKTGTITSGKPIVSQLLMLHSKEKDVLQLIASLEHLSEHPLAKAIVKRAQQAELSLLPVENFTIDIGKGVYGTVANQQVAIGNQQVLVDAVPTDLQEQVRAWENLGQTVLYVVIDRQLCAVLAVTDEIKMSSAKSIHALQAQGISVVMLTGDNHHSAKSIAHQVGISDVVSGVLPTDKAHHIKMLQAQGKCVAMVGDGINDAPALAQADVGIAIGSGTDIALESGDMIVMSSELNGVVQALCISKRTVRIIKENLFWAFAYNVLAIPIAMGLFYPLLLNPMLAGLAMACSSVSVILNALRLRK